MNTYTRKFNEIQIGDVAIVGGKNASLGEMFSRLSAAGIAVPDGFAVTADAFRYFLRFNQATEQLQQLMAGLDRTGFTNLRQAGLQARTIILNGSMPPDLSGDILQAYRELCGNQVQGVAVRSSATAEDLPGASFAGQHESFLNVKGETAVLKAVQQCFASLYTDRAIKYREDNHFRHEEVALSVGVQIMVRSDKACSGVGFTLDPESGFRDVVHIAGVWGLGENIVQGTVTPDEYWVFKPTLRLHKQAIVQRKLGSKTNTMIYGDVSKNEPAVINTDTLSAMQEQFVLNDGDVLCLARWALLIEEHYHAPMDFEWAKDGNTGRLFIVQARPETVQAKKSPLQINEYKLLQKGKLLVSGMAVGNKIASGIARVLQHPGEADKLQEGEIVVTGITSPDWDPVLKKAAAIITDKGGRTSHASIVARELGVPAVIGCGNATATIQDGSVITVVCSEGNNGSVYEGKLNYACHSYDFGKMQKPLSVEVMLIVADPGQAFRLSFYPNDGVGLLRMEFIIMHAIQVHPMALVKFAEIQNTADREKIEQLTKGYADKKKYFTDKLSQGIATIAAAFYPKDVIVRMSDFKTNEYASLVGGKQFEPEEENPMLGFRGASRYYHPLYREAFEMECEAIRIVREDMGLTNVKVMIPFCRTTQEAHKVIAMMGQNGLSRERDNTLEIYAMAEIPSNVLLAGKFAALFDGFSIGSNDLTQLTLGVDRDSSLVADLFNEDDEAVHAMIEMMIKSAKEAGVHVGLCGQAPSDLPGFAQFLVANEIDSISFNPDALIGGIENIIAAESKTVFIEK